MKLIHLSNMLKRVTKSDRTFVFPKARVFHVFPITVNLCQCLCAYEDHAEEGDTSPKGKAPSVLNRDSL